jgi:DNA repair protein RadC
MANLFPISEIKVISIREVFSDELSDPAAFAAFWQEVIPGCSWYDSEKEAVVVLLLDTGNKIKAFHLVTLGILNEALFHPREALRAAVVASANRLVLMHNHPSGNPNPSESDYAVTRRLRDAAQILGIDLLDHIVVGAEGGYFSFVENGWELPREKINWRSRSAKLRWAQKRANELVPAV